MIEIISGQHFAANCVRQLQEWFLQQSDEQFVWNDCMLYSGGLPHPQLLLEITGWSMSGSLLLLSDWSVSRCIMFRSSSVAQFILYDLFLDILRAGY